MAGIGTGRIISRYVRPTLEEIDKADLDRRLDMFKGKQLSLNMWLLRTRKDYIHRGAWLSEVVVRRQGKFYITSIPTSNKGTYIYHSVF